MAASAHHIAQHWSAGTIGLSYAISVTGSYCTIQVMEQWRQQEPGLRKQLLLVFASVALGGCGIWSMHFTGMNALQMSVDGITMLEVNFEGGVTILSLIFPILGVLVGLKVASTDPFFLEIEASRRKDILAKDLKNMKMDAVVKRSQVSKMIKYIALFSRLGRIVVGGFFAALGVLGMHYLGMVAQRTNAKMSFDSGIVALSSAIAFVTANAAFWIIFRALTFWPNYESLRIGSALIMGVAVCGTHYSGMGAASYAYTEENYADSTRFLMQGKRASSVASHGALLLCYWLSTFAVVVSLRREVLSSRHSKANNTTAGPNNNNTERSHYQAPPNGSRQPEKTEKSGPRTSFYLSLKAPSFNRVVPQGSQKTLLKVGSTK